MRPRLIKHQHLFIAFILFCFTFFVYFHSQNRFVKDSRWAIHVASSMINAGDADLNEFRQVAANINFTSTASSGGQLFSYFPVGNSILILPIVWVVEQIHNLSASQTFYEYLQQTSPHHSDLVSIQHFAASLIVALTMPILYYIGLTQFGRNISIVGVLIFAFGTSAYSTASLVLWQHGPSMLMLTITLALFIRSERTPSVIQWAGIPLAFSFIIRPTNSIPIVIFTLIVLLRYRRQLPAYLLGAMVIAIPFLWSSQHVYTSFLPPYYQPQRVGSSSHLTEALIGNLISPGRGVFIFSPILLFMFYGIVAKLQRVRLTLLEISLAIIIVLHWILISTFAHWWGGGSYGSRLFTDMMPYMIYFVMMGLYELNRLTARPRFRMSGMVLFTIFALFSVAIHYVGANRPIVDQWSRWPVDIEMNPSMRLWDWEDIYFFRTAETWPFMSLPANITFELEELQTAVSVDIPLRNHTDEAYLWEIKLPFSLQMGEMAGITDAQTDADIATIVGETPLSANAIQSLPIIVQKPLDSFVDPSLGAIMVTARTELGEEVSVQVIPVSIVNNGRSWQNANAISNQVWLPADIQKNGSKADSSLYGLYGSGWYALESFEQYQWRWAQSPAELYIFSTKPRNVTLELVFNSIYDETHTDGASDTGQLHISTGEEEWAGQVRIGEPNRIPITLDKGWNTLLFRLEAGNFSPADLDATSSDRRALSFSLNSINVVTID